MFEQGYTLVLARGLLHRAVIVLNSHDPTGDVDDRMVIEPMLKFAAEKELHVIVDEIYALSRF